jgi:chromosome segregation ATPase
MIISLYTRNTFVALMLTALVSLGSDIRTAQAEFERCESTMERVRRGFTRYEETIHRLKERTEKHSSGTGAESLQKITKLENELEYIRGSIDRAAGQAVKIRSDIANIKGPTCPSCLNSSINMFCRNSERLLTEIEEHQYDVSTFEEQLRSSDRSGTISKNIVLTNDIWKKRRNSIDSLLSRHQQGLDSCTGEAGISLWKQCKINLLAADSLHQAGAAQRRDQAIKMVYILLTKVIKTCCGELFDIISSLFM